MRAADLLAVALVVACSSNTARAPSPAETSGSGHVAVPAPPDAQGDPHMNLDDVLQRASSSTFATYDPGPVIEAVNVLLPLGKDGALAAIDAFLGKQDLAKDPHQGLFLVLRVLFEADPHPPMQLGGSRPSPPPSSSSLPRFPIMIVDDVPLMLVASYTLRGLPEPVTAHVEYYRKHGTPRAAPLAPSAGPDRMAAYERQYQAAYSVAPPAPERALVRAEFERLKL